MTEYFSSAEGICGHAHKRKYLTLPKAIPVFAVQQIETPDWFSQRKEPHKEAI